MAYLEITLQIDPKDRAAAADVYNKYKQPFLADVPGAQSKDLLVRDEDVQVLHGFDARTPIEELGTMIHADPTFHRGIQDELGVLA